MHISFVISNIIFDIEYKVNLYLQKLFQSFGTQEEWEW